MHASVEAGTDSETAVRKIKQMLAERFAIAHATVEIEYGACGDDHGHKHGHAQAHEHDEPRAPKQAACQDS
jgi:hypothetical protein